MQEYEDIFDEEYDLWQEEERQRQEDYFDTKADEMYEQYVYDTYKQLDDTNQFVLIYNTSSVREYIIPGTDIYKTEILDEKGNVRALAYGKKPKGAMKENE